MTTNVLWDRRTDGGFPETKELKRRVRDVVEPQRDLGHVDRDHGKPDEKKDEKKAEEQGGPKVVAETEKKECEDCKYRTWAQTNCMPDTGFCPVTSKSIE